MLTQSARPHPSLTVDPARRTVRAVITAAAPDRAGDVVVPAGLLNAAEFLANPVVLWNHRRDLPPIGICEALTVEADRVIATTKFAAGVPLADDLFRLYEQGVLRGWSIGFVPRKAKPLSPKHLGRASFRYDAWDLLEYSAVPVPEHPAALTLAIEKGLVADDRLRAALGAFGRDCLAGLVA